MKSIVPSDGKMERLEATNAELLKALQDMILATRRRVALAKAVAVIAKAEAKS